MTAVELDPIPDRPATRRVVGDRRLLLIPAFAVLLSLMAHALGWLPWGGLIPSGPV